MDNAAFDPSPEDDEPAGDDDAVPVAFPTGMRVVVTGGQYEGDRGEVVNHRPDLRPWSVWVRLDLAGTRLLPSYRLNRA